METKRLISIDILRGVAAIIVVLHHVFLPHATNSMPTNSPGFISEFFTLGFAGVWLFIVISGFCIHLKAAAAIKENKRPAIKFLPFWRRRIIRLYPAFLVALLTYIVILNLKGSIEFDWFFFYDLLLHLLMMHNLDSSTVLGFCGVFWTLALEEQLYLAYFLLLPLRMSVGWKTTLVVCFLAQMISYGVHFAVKNQYGIELPTRAFFTSQWFVWALGALSVEAHYGVVKLPTWCRDIRAGILVLLVSSSLILFDRFNPDTLARKPFWLFRDPLLGIGFFIIVNSLVNSEDLRGRVVFEGKWLHILAFVGLFSYSLYLTHQMIVIHFSDLLCSLFGIENNPLLLLSLVPLCLLLGWVFFSLFENPFITILQGPKRSSSSKDTRLCEVAPEVA